MPSMRRDTSSIILQPNDYYVAYKFVSAACSSDAANDGNIPYGTNVSSAAVTAKDADGNTVTDLVAEYATADNVVTVKLSYPSISGDGKYSLTFALTLDNGETVIEEDYNRVIAKDR